MAYSTSSVAGRQQSILGGRLFFREPDFRRRLAAGLLILMGVLVVAWRGRLEALIAP